MDFPWFLKPIIGARKLNQTPNNQDLSCPLSQQSTVNHINMDLDKSRLRPGFNKELTLGTK